MTLKDFLDFLANQSAIINVCPVNKVLPAVANIKSAIKRVQVAERNRLRNKAYKSAVRTLMKNCLSAVDTYATSPSPDQLKEVQTRLAAAYSKIDKAVKRGVLHPNNGARKKSRLARAVKVKSVGAQAS